MKKIAIVGAGGFGREVAQLIKDINKIKNRWNLIGFFDDDPVTIGKNRNGFPVLGTIEEISDSQYSDVDLVCALGNPKTKRIVIERIKKLNTDVEFATLIHPSTILGDENIIGEGSIVCAGNVITTNVTIGKHVIVNISSTIGHDVILDDYCTVLPGVNISGNVRMHEGVDVGTGTAIIPGVEIGKYAIIGAGAVVTRSLPEYCTAVGIPAKPIKFHNE